MPKKASSTNVKPLSGEQAKKRLYSQGITLRKFAETKGFKYRTVSDVVRGLNRGLYGEGHQVAVALGMKTP